MPSIFRVLTPTRDFNGTAYQYYQQKFIPDKNTVIQFHRCFADNASTPIAPGKPACETCESKGVQFERSQPVEIVCKAMGLQKGESIVYICGKGHSDAVTQNS